MTAVETLLNEEMPGGGKKGKEKMSVLLSIKKEQTGGAKRLRIEKEEKLFSEMLTPTWSE